MIIIKDSIALSFPRFHVSAFPKLLLTIARHLNIFSKIHLYWGGERLVIAMGRDTVGPSPTNQIYKVLLFNLNQLERINILPERSSASPTSSI